MSDRFFTTQPLAPGEVALDKAEAHHLSTVRRFAVGEHVTLFNGDGREYPAEILAIAKKSVVLLVTEPRNVDRELPYPLVIASAVPKGDRADFLLEKLTELGVTTWIPLHCERSVVLPRDAKLEKFERAVIEASKQCGRNRLMKVEAPRTLLELSEPLAWPGRRVLLHPGESGASSRLRPTGEAVLVAIGPEGGFSPAEVQSAVERGWASCQLGQRVLRIETAAITAAAILAQDQ